MIGRDLDLGSLNEPLGRAVAAENILRSIGAAKAEDLGDVADAARRAALAGGENGKARNLLRSAGPVSDAYILGTDSAMLITGPGGSGKTTASVKKVLVEGQRIFPGPDGVRRYMVGVWRQKYVNLWKATIPSWWSVLPADMPGSKWTGSSPREAQHVIRFEDAFGPIEITATFRAFGEGMDPDDVLGNQYTDCYLNEWSTLPEELFIALVDRVGRDPPRSVIRRSGAFFGDSNAPDVLNYCYRDFYESVKPGYKLYRQPGGLDHNAENIAAQGRGYWEHSAKMNAHRPWWVRRMVHALPGFTRANDPVYAAFDDPRNIASARLEHYPELPIIVGIDGGLTPAGAYMQERSDGQLRVYAEVALERGGMRELATAMLALEQSRFPSAEFVTVCDPSMLAGEDTADGSDRSRLAAYLGRKVNPAPTNNPDQRWEAVRAKLRHSCDGGVPGLIVDPSCKGIRRGFNQTYAFRQIAGTNDRGTVQKTFDSHVHDALQAGALLCGTAAAQRRTTDLKREAETRRKANREAKRYSPLGRRRA